MHAKYIVVKTANFELPIVFDNILQHSDMIRLYPEEYIVSAGFVTTYTDEQENGDIGIKVSCYGESVTLAKTSRPEEDSRLVYRMLTRD